MVDFCIYLDPTGMKDSDAAARIEEVRKHLPEMMINHTVNDSLRHRPIALSIETKKPGKGDDNAALQIGVWHSAQWNLLRSMGNDKRHGEGSAEGDAVASISGGGGCRGVSFLPAIIIQGHEWNFAATTRKNGTTVRTWPHYIPTHLLAFIKKIFLTFPTVIFLYLPRSICKSVIGTH